MKLLLLSFLIALTFGYNFSMTLANSAIPASIANFQLSFVFNATAGKVRYTGSYFFVSLATS